MTRILTFNYEYPPLGGGGGYLCRDVMEEFVSQGHEVTVVTSAFSDLADQETVNGVEILRVPVLARKGQNSASIISMLSYYPSAIRRANDLLKTRQFDIINTYFAIPSGPVGNHIAKKHGLPNVLSLMGGDVYDPSKTLSPHKTPMLKQAVAKVLRDADHVFAGSSEIQRGALEYYGIDRDVDVVPFGIKPFDCLDISRDEAGVPQDRVILLTIGRLVARKNLDDLVDVIALVKQQYPVRLYIMGGGPQMEHLQQRIDDEGLQQEIVLLGRVSDEDKARYVSASDIYVSTSIHEGFGLVFLEGMNCGLPVVSYDVGGQTDFLLEGKTGYIARLGNTREFAEKLSRLLADGELRQKISEFNRQHVRQYYVANACKRYLQVFDEVIKNHSSAA